LLSDEGHILGTNIFRALTVLDTITKMLSFPPFFEVVRICRGNVLDQSELATMVGPFNGNFVWIIDLIKLFPLLVIQMSRISHLSDSLELIRRSRALIEQCDNSSYDSESILLRKERLKAISSLCLRVAYERIVIMSSLLSWLYQRKQSIDSSIIIELEL
jgi:hypothetical protein